METQNKFKGLGIQYIDENICFSSSDIPQKWLGGYYKLMRLDKDGNLHFPKVKDIGVIEMDEIVIARDLSEDGKLKLWFADKNGEYKQSGQAQRRPGIHVTTIPYAPQLHVFGPEGQKNYINPNYVWCEVEVANDAGDFYEKIAHNNALTSTARGSYNQKADIRNMVPYCGCYPYFASIAKFPDYLGDKIQNHWIITGAMRIIRILHNCEIEDILVNIGFKKEDIPRFF